MVKNFKILYIIVLLTAVIANLCGQEMVIPMVKTPFPVHGATWNKNGSCFAYTEEDSIVVRDAEEYSLVQTIPTDGGTLRFMQYTRYTEGVGDQLATLSADNTLEIRLMPDPYPLNSVDIDSTNFPTALAYNLNGNYLATADTGNSIYIYMQNYLTETLIERRCEILSKPANSLCFSNDNKYLAVGCEDDQIYVVDVSTGKVLFSVYYPNALNVTPLFTPDNEGLIYPTKKKEIIVADFYGNIERTIKVKKEISSIALSPDGLTLIVSCKDNQFYYYELATGKYTGYIPRYSHARLTCYDYNFDGSKLLQGYSDGCIYILDVKECFLLPHERPPRFSLYVADDLVSDKGKKLSPEDLEKGRKRGGLYTKSGHEVVFDGSFAVLPEPYTMAVSLGAGYKNYDLIRPFYFGGEMEPFFGFPQDNFPYSYKLRGGSIKSPKLCGVKIYVPAGFAFMPFNNDVEVFAEVLTGSSLCWLWDGMFGDSYITSKVFPSMYVAAKVGAGWRNFGLALRGEYDTILRFSFSADLSYHITLPKKFK